jgi:hypothetical protein
MQCGPLRRAAVTLCAIQRSLNAIQELAPVERLGKIADDAGLKCSGTNIIARIGSYQYGRISMPNRDKLSSKSRPLIFGMLKSTTRQPVRLSSADRKNCSPDENALAINPTERIKTSIEFPTALSSSTIAIIGLVFGTWHDR